MDNRVAQTPRLTLGENDDRNGPLVEPLEQGRNGLPRRPALVGGQEERGEAAAEIQIHHRVEGGGGSKPGGGRGTCDEEAEAGVGGAEAGKGDGRDRRGGAHRFHFFSFVLLSSSSFCSSLQGVAVCFLASSSSSSSSCVNA